MNNVYKTDLSVKIGGFTLKNPVMPASGTFEPMAYKNSSLELQKLGAIMLKTVTYRKSTGNPKPRVTELANGMGMLNSIGIPSVGLHEFVDGYLPAYAALGVPVILSISGKVEEEYSEAVRLVADNPHISILELNLSCPNIGTGLPFSSDPGVMHRTLAPLRKLTRLPMMAKLSPMVSDICATAKVAENCGMDAVTLCNTFPGMAIDTEKRKPVLGNCIGGVSGPAVKPLVMRIVYQAYKAVSIPIVASGGIESRDDAIEYFLAGASAVQVGSANFVKPDLIFNLPEELDEYLYAHKTESVHLLTGMAHR